MSGFSFNLRTEYALAPLSLAMIERVLGWNEIDPADVGPVIADRILQFVRDGSIDRDFIKWLRSPDAPNSVTNLDKKWAALLFGSISLVTYSHHNYQQSLAVSEGLPYWQLDCMTVFCASHSVLDGLVARFDDPIWKSIYPPNGWLCGCGVSPMVEEEALEEKGINMKVSPEILATCRNWLDVRPDCQYDLL
jgi:hypothetical protein